MQDSAVKTDEMLALARSRAPADRERLLAAICDLCEGAAELSAEAERLVRAIFLDLVVQAERDIRRRLSERLAGADWAPHALVAILALDDIEIARPVIAQSPVLGESDLIRLLVEATLEHQIEVARRPGIGAPVVGAILDQGEPDVLAALADNQTAEVEPLQMRRLVGASRRLAALRGPLARHPRLTEELAHALYGWVGAALRARIAERFAIDPGRLREAMESVVADAADGAPGPAERARAAADPDRQAEMERRLVEKLDAAGQLRPGYLLRALREGRQGLFEAALESLGRYPRGLAARAVAAGRPDLLALACAGVGIDRSAFPTILSLVRANCGGRPAGAPGAEAKVAAAFAFAPEQAAEAFRARAGAI